MLKILFLGLTHDYNDDRLKFRQVYKIKEADPSVECAYLGRSSLKQVDDNLLKVLFYKENESSGFLSKTQKLYKFLKMAIQYKPDIIQASDVRELLYVFIINSILRRRLIYDSHEDYFNQFYEYSNKSAKGLIKGIMYRGIEILLIRFADAVFCTDEYLYDLYRKPYFGCKVLYLLRNFVNLNLVEQKAEPPKSEEPFRLVYVGGFNKYRGIIESAEYVRKYNEEKGKICLILDLYGPYNPIIDKATKINECEYKGFISHEIVIKTIPKYHAGICLLKRIKKYERNLPIKNFEYMSVGLPVITSNFGNLSKYIIQSQGGICIDPDSYEQFKCAVEKLMDPEIWMIYSNNGYSYTRSNANLDIEIAPYLNFILS